MSAQINVIESFKSHEDKEYTKYEIINVIKNICSTTSITKEQLSAHIYQTKTKKYTFNKAPNSKQRNYVDAIIGQIKQTNTDIPGQINAGESTEQTEPSKQVEQTGPNKQVEQTEPNKQVEQTEPSKQVEQTEPNKQVEQTGPSKQVEQTELSKPVEQTELSKPVEQTEPSKPAEQTEPSKQVEQTNPNKPARLTFSEKIKRLQSEGVLGVASAPRVEQVRTEVAKLSFADKIKLMQSGTDQKTPPPSRNRYVHPLERAFDYKKKTISTYEPFGTQSIYDVQTDDTIDQSIQLVAKQFDKLRAIVSPDQGTPEWHLLRNDKITASDGATALNLNPYDPRFSFIMKKVKLDHFQSNEFCYHGKKYEECATMIYEHRMNVMSDEFGLIGHETIPHLGASPDRICNHYKFDKLHKSKFVGRMVEIKCPFRRKIKMEGEIKDHICPLYYWIQVQLQLECCELEECDFWQCEIREYASRDAFISDTNPDEPYLSYYTGFEKSCLIELLPRFKTYTSENIQDAIYADAKFIYPPKIQMTPYECDVWVAKTLSELHMNEKYKNYCLNKVIYWKLVTSKNVLIKRDRAWFEQYKPVLAQTWKYVEFLRANRDKFAVLEGYINEKMKLAEGFSDARMKTFKQKLNDDVMLFIDNLVKT